MSSKDSAVSDQTPTIPKTTVTLSLSLESSLKLLVLLIRHSSIIKVAKHGTPLYPV